MNDQNFTNLPPTKWDFHYILKNLKNQRNFLIIRELFVLFCFKCTQRAHIEIEDGRKAP